MKKEDAIPGTLVVVPDKERYGKARQLMLDGGPCLRGVLLGYGRYRMQVQGLCGEAVVVEEKYNELRCAVLVQKPIPYNTKKHARGEEYTRWWNGAKLSCRRS